MKKLISAFLAIVFTFSMCSAFADVDLSGYSDDELIALLDQVQQEVADRKIEKTANLVAGTYVVGEDIPAGDYIITIPDSPIPSGSMSLFFIQKASNGNTVAGKGLHGEDITFRYTLEEGLAIESPIPFSLTIDAGVMFE